MAATLGKATIAPHDLTEIARTPLVADNCALVVVDVQEKLLRRIFEKERVIRNSALLVRLAKVLNLPVVLTTQYSNP